VKNYINLLNDSNKKSTLIFIVLNIILVFVESFSIALIPLVIDFAINENPLLPRYINFFENHLNNLEKSETLFYASIFFILIFILKNIYVIGLVAYQANLLKKFSRDIKKTFFTLYINAPFEIINSYNSSKILRNIENETSNYVLNFFLILKSSKDILLFLTIFLLLLFVDFVSTIIAISTLLFFLILYFFTFYKKLKELGEDLLSSKNYFIKTLLQSLSSIKTIKIGKKENIILNKFLDKIDVFEDARKKINIIQAIPNSLFEVTFVVVIFSLIIFISQSELKNILPILSLYIVSFIRLLPIFSRFGQTLSILRSSYPSVKHLSSEIEYFKQFKQKKEKSYNADIDLKFEKKIEIVDLSFKYLKGSNDVIKNLNLSIDKGKSIGFVGKSGSGKTTLVNLLCGLLSSSEGKITSDNVDIFNNIDSWQKKIGLVPQDNYLLDDTVINNILFLDEKKKVDQKKLSDALFYSGVSEFINKLNKGLNTIVGEKGSILSGGQVQRIALARLLYQDPKILILDEFTNSLDPESEDFILKKLELLKHKKDKNFFIISHKIKPLKICDEIIILENGRISKKYNFNEFYERFGSLYD
jgi:ATP-binding cassette, subfamily B, bacterial PglK